MSLTPIYVWRVVALEDDHQPHHFFFTTVGSTYSEARERVSDLVRYEGPVERILSVKLIRVSR